jgi:hypothetical protein
MARRSEKREDEFHLSVRLSADLIREIDEEGQQIEQERPGLKVTRTDTVRVLLTEALIARGRRKARA